MLPLCRLIHPSTDGTIEHASYLAPGCAASGVITRMDVTPKSVACHARSADSAPPHVARWKAPSAAHAPEQKRIVHDGAEHMTDGLRPHCG